MAIMAQVGTMTQTSCPQTPTDFADP